MGGLNKGEKISFDIKGHPRPVKICRIPDCGEPVKAKNLCSTHHQRMRRTGSTESVTKDYLIPQATGKRTADWNQDAPENLMHDIKTPKITDTEKGGIRENQRSYGIVRKIDGIGRFVLPKEYSIFHGALPGLPMEFFLDGQAIMLQVYNPGCYFCGSVANMMVFKERKICRSCIDALMGETCHDGH